MDDEYCDGPASGKLFLTGRIITLFFVDDTYPDVVCDTEKAKKTGDFIYFTDDHFRGGMGGGDHFYYLRIVKIENQKLIPLFAEKIGYFVEPGLESSFPDRYGYFAFENDSILYIAVEDHAILGDDDFPTVKEVSPSVIKNRKGCAKFIYRNGTFGIPDNEDSFKRLRNKFLFQRN